MDTEKEVTERELGYLDGIKAVRSLLFTFKSQNLPGFDLTTCEKLYTAACNLQFEASRRIYASDSEETP